MNFSTGPPITIQTLNVQMYVYTV